MGRLSLTPAIFSHIAVLSISVCEARCRCWSRSSKSRRHELFLSSPVHDGAKWGSGFGKIPAPPWCMGAVRPCHVDSKAQNRVTFVSSRGGMSGLCADCCSEQRRSERRRESAKALAGQEARAEGRAASVASLRQSHPSRAGRPALDRGSFVHSSMRLHGGSREHAHAYREMLHMNTRLCVLLYAQWSWQSA